ncbi:MAG: V-type ATP synthase subunit E family protein [Elusimicrobiota bacterium]
MENKKLQNILDGITKETQKEADIIRIEAEREIERMRGKFEDKKKRLINEKKSEFNRNGELIKKEMITREKLRVKKQLLNKKRDLIEGIFDRIMEILNKSDKSELLIPMEKLLVETVTSKNEIVRPAEGISPVDTGFISGLNRKYGWKLKLGEKNPGISGGFVIEGENYETVVDWANIKDHIRETYEDMVAKELFEGKLRRET